MASDKVERVVYFNHRTLISTARVGGQNVLTIDDKETQKSVNIGQNMLRAILFHLPEIYNNWTAVQSTDKSAEQNTSYCGYCGLRRKRKNPYPKKLKLV